MKNLTAEIIIKQWADSSNKATELDTDLCIPVFAETAYNGDPAITLLLEDKPHIIADMRSVTVTVVEREAVLPGENWRLSFTLHDPSLLQAFAELCLTFMRRIGEETSQKRAMRNVYDSILQWKRMLKPMPAAVALETLRGAVAELVAVPAIATALNTDSLDVLQHWTGPEGAPQDFIFNERELAREVKAVRRTSKRVDISSPEQLESEPLALQLVIVEMEDDNPTSTDVKTLPVIVEEVCKTSSDYLETKDIIEDGLFQLGIPMFTDMVQNTGFVIKEISFYDVQAGFPRITSQMLPNGIDRVRYSIELDAIKPYAIASNKEQHE